MSDERNKEITPAQEYSFQKAMDWLCRKYSPAYIGMFESPYQQTKAEIPAQLSQQITPFTNNSQPLNIADLIDLIKENDGEKVVIGISGGGNFAYKTIRRI